MEMTEDPINAQAAFVSYSEFGDLEKMRELSDRFEPTTPMRLVTESFIRFTNSDYEGAIAVFEGSELDSDMEGKYVYPMISKAAIKLGDYTLARDNLLRFNPLLSRDAEKNVDRQNLGDAILLAYIYKQTGEDQRAAELLAEASQVIRSMPRIGAAGYGISDVHILAIQGRRDAALEALRDAIDEGVVTLMPYDYWTLDQDPIIDSLRSDDRFRTMKIELDEKIEDMRDNVERAQESGDWSELLGRIRKSELTAALVDW
jgi:tetratricopeptide (TPR) repeat protein